MLAKLSTSQAAQILLTCGRPIVVEGSDASLSWPFDTLIGAFCAALRALSDAPISVANGLDLHPLREAWFRHKLTAGTRK